MITHCQVAEKEPKILAALDYKYASFFFKKKAAQPIKGMELPEQERMERKHI